MAKVGQETQHQSKTSRKSAVTRTQSLAPADLLGDETKEYMVMRTMYLTPALDNRLKSIAARQGKSKNQLLREILASHVQQHGLAMTR